METICIPKQIWNIIPKKIQIIIRKQRIKSIINEIKRKYHGTTGDIKKSRDEIILALKNIDFM